MKGKVQKISLEFKKFIEIMSACQAGVIDYEVAKAFLQEHPGVLKQTDLFGSSLLHILVDNHDVDLRMLGLLIDSGIDISLRDNPNTTDGGDVTQGMTASEAIRRRLKKLTSMKRGHIYSRTFSPDCYYTLLIAYQILVSPSLYAEVRDEFFSQFSRLFSGYDDLRQFIGQNFMQPIESQLVRGSQ